MKIKTKLILAFVFLLVEFLFVSLFSLYFIFKISQQNNLITKNNNLSISYSENMLKSMDKINDFNSSSIFNPHFVPDIKELSLFLTNFEKNLVNEENNITETGEKELARSVRENFEKFKSLMSDSVRSSVKDKSGYYYTILLPTVNEIKFALFAISDINMNAIIRKNLTANDTAGHSYIVLSIIATIFFLVFFAFIFGFPKYIADPIEILAKNVNEIANKNFKVRMAFNTNDEFGQISKAFNDIVVSLEEYNKFETEILIERKELAESIIRRIDEPVLILDVNQNIIVVSILAEKLLNLNYINIINKSASEVAQKNELLRFMLRSLIQDTSFQTNTFTLTSNDIKTIYTSEMNIITKPGRNSDLVVPIGYLISLKKLSKSFD
jgi:nitrogen fixation/metabolism regulation signal transduction histidine kinase